ncbi:MAG: GDP-mannose 4,6-dehydratase [Gammaproteobacteria bacterium]|nr:GDP-mannose 4,6-dehydratase [Gammaproteobacteria bacterium]
MEPHALVTGGAGFIGSHLIDQLLAEGARVTVVDNFDPHYDPALKRANLAPHRGHPRLALHEIDLRDAAALNRLPGEFDLIVHLAARAGVRTSLADPVGYQAANVMGTVHLLEFARRRGIRGFVFGSSSSVYGGCPRLPWREDDPDLTPLNPYASSKLAGEHLCRIYAELFGLRVVSLRFFTVFGPRQRPDLAIHKFARLMLDDQPIPVYGDGSTARDYTYVGDIVAGVCAALRRVERLPAGHHEIYNLGNSRTVRLDALIAALEAALRRHAMIERLPEQPGDMHRTWADIGRARRQLGFAPATDLETGLARFADWLHAGAGEAAAR